jgi:hypothetical protein
VQLVARANTATAKINFFMVFLYIIMNIHFNSNLFGTFVVRAGFEPTTWRLLFDLTHSTLSSFDSVYQQPSYLNPFRHLTIFS